MKQITTLVPCSKFIMQDFERPLGQDIDAYNLMCLTAIKNYAKFLQRPLELWMFVACDANGVSLVEPLETDLCASFFEIQTNYKEDVYYQDAREKCLFEGFSVEYLNVNDCGTCVRYNDLKIIFYSNRIEFDSDIQSDWQLLRDIEQLRFAEIKLTPTAIQEIYGR